MTAKGGKSFKDYKKSLLKDPVIRQEYEALEKSYEIARIIYNARTEANLTQEQLASRIGTRQANISRAEKGNTNITIGTLLKIAEATGYQLSIDFKPVGVKQSSQRKASAASARNTVSIGKNRLKNSPNK